jgi:nucleoside-diphosphate-sugar epimerase
MATIFVSGASGFIGRHLVELLPTRGQAKRDPEEIVRQLYGRRLLLGLMR